MQLEKSPVYLYILMRTDLASMNAGKAIAQGAHAANQFQTMIQRAGLSLDKPSDTNAGDLARYPQAGPLYGSQERNNGYLDLYREWLIHGCTKDGFGTTITLGCSGLELATAMTFAKENELLCSITHDPTYPLQDGAVTHLLPLDTCGFIFARQSDVKLVAGDLPLMGLCGAATHRRGHAA